MTKIWLSYDLGIKGDYNGLYTYLDSVNATECGNSVAYFETEIEKEIAKEILLNLKSFCEIRKTDRLYLVMNKGTKTVSGFLLGKKQSPPWEGYYLGSNTDFDISKLL